MNERIGRISSDLRRRQHGLFAVWQLRRWFGRGQVERWLRDAQPPRVRRGVYGVPVAPFGAYMAAALALGPDAAVSHRSGVELWGMREPEEGPIHVSVPGRGGRERRDGMVVHRPTRVPKAHRHGIPVMTPTQCLKQADLEPYELYVALENADRHWLPVDRPTLPLSDVVRLQQAIHGRTRSDAEARFVLLCAERGWPLPLVNHRLNGILTDFHWPDARLVVEVDGWEFHKERPQFEEDRRRGLVHNGAGYTVTRVSALQVAHEPELVVAAVRGPLSLSRAPSGRSRRPSARRSAPGRSPASR